MGKPLPLLFLLFIAMASGALAAHAGRDELRHHGEASWRSESFLAYALFVGLVLLPITIYFYVFHGDWFLLYWIDTASAPWVFGFVSSLLLAGASLVGFHAGAALCRASRDQAARRITIVGTLAAWAVWPLAWERLSVLGSHRQFARDYGLVPFFSSPAFYSGLVMMIVGALAFAWVVFRVDQQTRDVG